MWFLFEFCYNYNLKINTYCTNNEPNNVHKNEYLSVRSSTQLLCKNTFVKKLVFMK